MSSVLGTIQIASSAFGSSGLATGPAGGGFLVVAFTFLTGACVGSFLNVCIARWPAGLSVVSPPSRCPNCERGIRAHENVPIVGWLTLRGRCAGCALPISAQYPLVELLVALLWLGTVLVYGPSLTALRVAVFATVLLGVAVTDAKHYLIPDGFTVFGLAWVLATAFAAQVIGGDSPFAGPYDALIGAFAGAGAIAVAGWLGEVALKREAMGFGDVTLMAVAGAALGPDRALLTIFVAAAMGVVAFAVLTLLSVLGVRKLVTQDGAVATEAAAEDGAEEELPRVPFGVFLAPAALVSLLFGDAVIHWYVSRFLSA